MNENIVNLITQVNDQYPNAQLLENPIAESVPITNYIFMNGVDMTHWEVGVLVVISKFNAWSDRYSPIISTGLTVDIISSAMGLNRSEYKREVVSALDSLVNKEIINIQYIGNPKTGDSRRYNDLFTVSQRFYSKEEDYSSETWEALNGVLGMKDTFRERATTHMYRNEIDLILALNTTPGVKVKLLSTYVATCKPIFFYNPKAITSSKNVDKIIEETSRAVNWEGVETIGRRARFLNIKSSRKYLKILVQNNILARFDVGFRGANVHNTRAYISRYMDAKIMKLYICNQIKKGQIMNVFEGKYK